MTKTEQKLWHATKTGNYPPGTTAQTLNNIKNYNGDSALHEAALSGQYPPGTTAQDLANTKNNQGWSALHDAATYGHYPPGTTAQDLINTKNRDGYTALHSAVSQGHLPPDTTIALLKTTKDNEGCSAWNYLCNCLKNNPTYALAIPPHLFQEDNELAITTVQTTITKIPSLHGKAAIWLGKVLAGDQTQRDRTTTTPYTSP